jgi:ABC-type branched-subunit amino acid transport system ATPase component
VPLGSNVCIAVCLSLAPFAPYLPFHIKILNVVTPLRREGILHSFLERWERGVSPSSATDTFSTVNTTSAAESAFVDSVSKNGSGVAYYGGVYISNVNFGKANSFGAGIIFNDTMPLSLPVLMEVFAMALGFMPSERRVTGRVELLPAVRSTLNVAFLQYGPILLEYSIVFLAPLFAVSVITERERNQKQLLLLSGLSAPGYWMGTLLSDFLISMIPSSIVAFGGAAAGFPGFRACGAMPVWILYAFLALSNSNLAYLISFIFSKEEVANRWLFSAYSFTTLIPFLVVNILLKGLLPAWVDALLRIFPGFAFSRAVTGLASIESANMTCQASFDATYLSFIVMSIEAILFFLAIVFIEYASRFGSCRCRRGAPDLSLLDEDDESTPDDVLLEAAKARSSGDVIRIIDVKKEFPGSNGSPVAALRGVSLSVKQGELLCLRTLHFIHCVCTLNLTGISFVLVGHNGAGKSTLISLLTGQASISSGTILLDSSRHTNMPMGVCMQQNNCLFDNLTGIEQLNLIGNIRAILEPETVIQELISTFRFESHADRKVSSYSEGNKRKLSVMCALLGDPKVIFLDEPSNALDASARRNLWNAISSARQRSGTRETAGCLKLVLTPQQFRRDSNNSWNGGGGGSRRSRCNFSAWSAAMHWGSHRFEGSIWKELSSRRKDSE